MSDASSSIAGLARAAAATPNGRIGDGRTLHVAGQIGWNATACSTRRTSSVSSRRRSTTSSRVLQRRAAARRRHRDDDGLRHRHRRRIARARKALGPIWRERLGTHFPAMALVAVTALVEPEALVEIQAIAYLGARGMTLISADARSPSSSRAASRRSRSIARSGSTR